LRFFCGLCGLWGENSRGNERTSRNHIKRLTLRAYAVV
jgi:hypothetical protein